MPDETTVVVTEQEDAADVEAARAAASATQATEAAAAALALAQVQAANVTEAASVEIASYEERLNQCQEQIESLNSQAQAHQGAMAAQLEAMRTEFSSILKRLEPPPEPSPESPPSTPSEATKPEAAAEPEAPRRKAHRWI